jgi:hypothetical protein
VKFSTSIYKMKIFHKGCSSVLCIGSLILGLFSDHGDFPKDIGENHDVATTNYQRWTSTGFT